MIPMKYSLYPIENLEVWELYKKAQSSYWSAEELDFNDDDNCIKKLTENEMFFIKMILSFFATSDGIVNENLNWNFLNDFEDQEIKCFYGFQVMMENIHSESYSLLLEKYVKDKDEREKCFNAVETIPCIRRKADFCFRYMDNEAFDIAHRLIAFACVEGIFFSGAFCSIFWLKKRGFTNGLTFSNELISRDEGLHTQFACLLYKQIGSPLEQKEVEEIISEAVDIETEFICESLPCNLLGMNSELMTKYIRFVADVLLSMLGYEKMYKEKNPFDFMEMISLQGKSNFFEKRVSEYQVKSDIGTIEDFCLDADF